MSIASPWGPVRLTTAAMAVIVFAVVAARTRRPGLAAVTVVACLWSYEAVWNATDIAVHGWGWGPEPYWAMLAAGWTGWMLSRGWMPSLRLLALFAAAHLAWAAAGFPYNFAGRPWTWSGEAWNAATKALWLLAWGLGSERAGLGAGRLGSLVGLPTSGRAETSADPDPPRRTGSEGPA